MVRVRIRKQCKSLSEDQYKKLKKELFNRIFGTGTYLLVITSRKEVGTYLGFPVFRVMSMKFMACNGILRLSSCQEVRTFVFVEKGLLTSTSYFMV
ncbi:hypothetical protein IFM89_006521 [Coptis chinensis]|uniref:Uncharacterized protein n=1 Tax=Coptis chinensis TaxID=261450 RepID=A0A835ILD6_9MAGN|nr:hypothetical protein IFM89_006521 [Coptis chinensis]